MGRSLSGGSCGVWDPFVRFVHCIESSWDAEVIGLKMVINFPVTHVKDSVILCFVQIVVDGDMSVLWSRKRADLYL